MMHLIIHKFQYMIGTFHIIRSVFKTQFLQYTKYAKYVFLLLLSIHKYMIVRSLYFFVNTSFEQAFYVNAK